MLRKRVGSFAGISWLYGMARNIVAKQFGDMRYLKTRYLGCIEEIPRLDML